MKPAFKTTALAILVALGVTACGQSKNSADTTAPTPVNNQANTGNTQANNATQDAERARLEAEKKAQEAEQARLDAEKKAKEATDLKAKEEAEKARLEAEKKAKEAEQARLEAEKKAKEAADLKVKEEAEKVANEWRTAKATGANITEPNPSWTRGYRSKVENGLYGFRHTEGYEGPTEFTPIFLESNKGYELDYYRLAIEDKANPQVLGWHKGEIKSGGINGSEISKVEGSIITERTYPEKVNYIFKNTAYATYGAVYNNYESHLFTIHDKVSSVDGGEDTYQVGEYEIIDGNRTTKVKYTDSVKGAATYKGEVLAHITRAFNVEGSILNRRSLNERTPEVDGFITINANFGPREEESFATATLDSKALGKVEFKKARIFAGNNGISFGSSSGSSVDLNNVHLGGRFVGKNADEIVGSLLLDKGEKGWREEGDVERYEAVFAAEKQPK